MGIVEIILIIAGAVICILGYLMPARKEDMDETLQLIGEDEVRKVVDKEVEEAKTHISDIIDETVSYAIEKTERSMERVTNEKIMAVNEYSDTVLEEINKNHKEVLFLYDMLNDKHDNLKETVSEAARTAEEIKQTVKDAEITARETQESVKAVESGVREAEDAVRAVMTAALEARGHSIVPVPRVPELSSAESGRRTPAAFERNAPETAAAEFERRMPAAFERNVPEAAAAEFERRLPAAFERNASEAAAAEFERRMPAAFERNVSEAVVVESERRMPAVFEREVSETDIFEPERNIPKIDIPEFAGDVPNIGIPEFSGEIPDIGMPEFDEDDSDNIGEVQDREADYAEALEVARAVSYAGKPEDTGETAYDENPQMQEEDRFIPIAPPRVEIIHDPDSDYDYVAEPQQEFQRTETLPQPERMVENSPLNIQFLNTMNGKNNGRNSNERILELHKAGKSNMAIAKELGLGIGEVKLVIDLFEGL